MSFVSNAPVSWPVKFPNLHPEVNLGGVMFSYQWGFVYDPSSEPMQMELPPPQPTQ